MSLDETDLVKRLHAVAGRFDMPAVPPVEDVQRGRRRVRRHRMLMAGATAAAVVLVVGVTTVLSGPGREDSDAPEPVERPEVVLGQGPVWADAAGLHHGDVVEQPAVQPQVALALVRTGALYLDGAAGDVWFHPWGGEPRIVGRNSAAGPGGDPDGDVAVWFEGSDAMGGPGDLVVYDTSAGREISRTSEDHGVADAPGGDHYPTGNGFLDVSTDRVVWSSGSNVYSHDVRTGATSAVDVPRGLGLWDVHDQVQTLGDAGSAQRFSSALVLRVPGRPEARYPDLETHNRLSPDGNYVLSVEGTEDRHAAAILDVTTGEVWRVPDERYPWIAWSYEDVALIDTEDRLLACDASRRECEVIDAERPFLMPTN